LVVGAAGSLALGSLALYPEPRADCSCSNLSLASSSVLLVRSITIGLVG
jgi:hypothetical protein